MPTAKTVEAQHRAGPAWDTIDMGPTCACAHHHGPMADTPAVEDAAPSATLARYANPLLRLLFRTPLKRSLGRQLALLRFTGRRSGRTYCFPVGVLSVRGRRIITSRRSWQCELQRRHGLRRAARRGMAARAGGTRPRRRRDRRPVQRTDRDVRVAANAPRRLGLRINVDRAPTHEELVDAVRRIKLSIIHIDAAV